MRIAKYTMQISAITNSLLQQPFTNSFSIIIILKIRQFVVFYHIFPILSTPLNNSIFTLFAKRATVANQAHSATLAIFAPFFNIPRRIIKQVLLRFIEFQFLFFCLETATLICMPFHFADVHRHVSDFFCNSSIKKSPKTGN